MHLRATDISVRFPNQGFLHATATRRNRNQPGGPIIEENGRSFVRALDKISFEIGSGDRLALIGNNGAGKSTLLQVLAGIYFPTNGRVDCDGDIGSALDLNIGFRVEASGRRNIELKSLMAGCSWAQMPAIIDEIDSFSELGPYLDAPMRTYSTGMRARLAFGLLTALRHDVVLLDEWIGVGDANFQAKASARMKDFLGQTHMLVLASHNPGLLRETCTLGLVLNAGEQLFFGPLEEALEFHRKQQT